MSWQGEVSAKHSKYFLFSCIQLTRHVPTCHFNSAKLPKEVLCSRQMRSRYVNIFKLNNHSCFRKLHLTETRETVIQDKGSQMRLTANTVGLDGAQPHPFSWMCTAYTAVCIKSYDREASG